MYKPTSLIAIITLLIGCSSTPPAPPATATAPAPGAAASAPSPARATAAAMETSQPAQSARNDYGKPETWLCRPGHDALCTSGQEATVVAANGTLTRETWQPNANPAIDCFYVYPTVSRDPTPNSDMQAGPEEQAVVRGQFTRFASVCRPFAPLYRQVTLTALRAALAGQPMKIDFEFGYKDVLDAWNYYLAHDNNGRGVVLIGHSQGSRVLTDLVAREIEGKPVQSKIISVLLLGTNVMVPKGKDVGGTFKQTPLCRSETQTGCIITYVSFRADSPPPANSRFGLAKGDEVVACTNPAALGGGSGELHSYLSTAGSVTSPMAPYAWVNPPKPIDTPFVSLPGLLSAKCAADDKAAYLAITVNANPKDPRTDNIPGDVVVSGNVLKEWGLHLIDVHEAMGNLIDIVGKQGRAYLQKNVAKND